MQNLRKNSRPESVTGFLMATTIYGPKYGFVFNIFGMVNHMADLGPCKIYYHHQLRKVTKEATRHIDEILHRNRSIRLEIMGKHYLRNTFLALLPQ